MPKFWIGVASREHVENATEHGFCALNHGKEAPLKRMNKGDWIVYYSNREFFDQKEPCQKFTAIGKISDTKIYQREFNGFQPFVRNVKYYKTRRDAPIRDLLDNLSFITNKKRWGYPFRFGFFEITKEDMLVIAREMGAVIKSI